MARPRIRNMSAVTAEMRRLNIRAGDLEERFVLSSGKGGQNVNKTATCVWLCHRLSGISVKCHRERTQNANRILARLLLIEKIEAQRKKLKEAYLAGEAKQRRQKARRLWKVKEAILNTKRHNSLRKESRRKIFAHNMMDK